MRLLLLLLLLSFTAYGQEANELYTANDLLQLKRTTDSLQLRYKQCVPDPEYFSWPQTQATHLKFQLHKDKIPYLEALFNKNSSMAEVLKEFPEIAKLDTSSQLVAKYDTHFFHASHNEISSIALNNLQTAGQWIYRITNSYSDNKDLQRVEAWLLHQSFARIKLPPAYAKMIQYVDCVVDTSTEVSLAKRYQELSHSSSLQQLLNVVHMQRKVIPDSILHPEDQDYIRKHFYTDIHIRNLLNAAIKQAIDSSYGGEALDGFVYELYPKDTILLLKRSYQVIGYCSRDDGPRIHAMNIAKLASQTHDWPVFIRSHLDLMNDNFVRNADASYAENGRNTFLGDLEKLDIPVQQLLLGSIFRADKLSSGHYYGDLGRIGRAFTESSYTADFEKQVKACMKDEHLDSFNRYIFYILYTNYCYRLRSMSIRREKIESLIAEAEDYPPYINKGINLLKVY